MSSLDIAHVDAERGFSGGEVQVFLLLEGLRERGHSNLLVVPPNSAAEAVARERGFDVATCRMRSDVDLPSVLRLRRILARRAPDLVHLHTGRATWLGGLAARQAGVPALTTRRMDRVVKRGRRNRFIYGKLVRRAVAISPAVERRLREGAVPPERIRTIYSSIDPASLAPADGAAAAALGRELGLDLEDGTPNLISVGRLHERKGIDVWLTALAREPLRSLAWRALVVGDGPARPDLERLAGELGLEGRVHFVGTRQDVPSFLHLADVFVMPSRAEGLGVAALEAMALGRCVVASAVGGLADVVRDGVSGRLVPPEDPEALSGVLAELLGDPAARAALERGARQRVEEAFLASSMTAAYEALYREILAEASGEG